MKKVTAGFTVGLLLLVPVFLVGQAGFGVFPPAEGGGSGTVTSVATDCGLSGGTITTTGTLKVTVPVNAQVGTTYTVLAGDCGKLVTHTNAAAIAVTLPQAGASFPAGWYYYTQNRGAGTVTITPTTSTIDGATSLAMATSEGLLVVSDGTNYFTARGMGVGGGGNLTVQKNGVTVGTRSTLDLDEGTGILMAISDTGTKILVEISADLARLVDKTVTNTFTAGAKQIFQASATTAGLNAACAALPSTPANGDYACDSGDLNKVKVYSNGAWTVVGGGGGVGTNASVDMPMGACQGGAGRIVHLWSATNDAADMTCHNTETGGNVSTVRAQFPDTLSPAIVRRFTIPRDYASGGTFRIWFGQGVDSTPPSVAQFDVRVGCRGAGASPYDAWTYNAATATTAFSLTNNIFVIEAVSPDMTGCAASNFGAVKITRINGITDNVVGLADVHNVVFEYTRQ